MESKLLTRPEAAEALRISLATLNRHVKTGLIPVIKIGGRRFIRKDAVEKIIAGTQGGMNA